MGTDCSVKEEFARLTVKVEIGDSQPFEEKDFGNLVQQAIRVILGSVGPDYKVGDFDIGSRKGSVIAPGKDIQLIWAALSAFGLLFNRRVAVHFNALTEYTGEF